MRDYQKSCNLFLLCLMIIYSLKPHIEFIQLGICLPDKFIDIIITVIEHVRVVCK